MDVQQKLICWIKLKFWVIDWENYQSVHLMQSVSTSYRWIPAALWLMVPVCAPNCLLYIIHVSYLCLSLCACLQKNSLQVCFACLHVWLFVCAPVHVQVCVWQHVVLSLQLSLSPPMWQTDMTALLWLVLFTRLGVTVTKEFPRMEHKRDRTTHVV